MKLLVGLGNPGEKYVNNRHNAGFMMLDFLLKQGQDVKFKFDKHSQSKKLEFDTGKDRIILAKPQTFMNESGNSVKNLIINHQLSAINLVVVHDDLDIRLGEYKIQFGRGPKKHNGVESIEKALRTKDFWRVRIGVDNRLTGNRIAGETYVLQNFTSKERAVLKTVFDKVAPEVVNLSL